MIRRSLAMCSVLALSACGSVAIPGETVWRLTPPALQPQALSDTVVLRVQRLELLGALPEDRLVVATGPHRLWTRELDRWSGPLPDLVHDALLTGLSRSHAFAQVKGPQETGREDLTLQGRILDFHEIREDPRSIVKATLDLRVSRASDGKLLWQKELSRVVPTERPGAEGAVAALSLALQGIVGDLLQSCRDSGVVAAPAH